MKPKQVKFLSGDRELYNDFKLRHVIGMSNCVVFEVMNSDGKIECIKQVRLQDKMNEFIFRKQIQLLTKLKTKPHPNIVQYRGSYCLQEYKNQYNTIKKGYIQMQKEHRQDYFDQKDIISFLRNMIDVFAHLQKVEVAHRDIKPSNILVFNQDPLFFKICDVGAGTAVGYCDNTKQMTVIGTPYYLSPQLYQAHRNKMHLTNYKAYKSDAYSLGLLFLQFCTLQKMEDRLQKEQQRINDKISLVKELYPNIIGLGKVLRKMLQLEVSARMDFIELQKFIEENNCLRSIPVLILDQLKQLVIQILQQYQELQNIQTAISTQNKITALKININSSDVIGMNPPSLSSIPSLISTISNTSQPKLMHKNSLNKMLQPLDYLQKIKYLKLNEIILFMQMCELQDKHIIMITEALQKNKKLSYLSLNLWKVSNQGFRVLLGAIRMSNLKELVLKIPNNPIRIDLQIFREGDFNLPSTLNKLSMDISFTNIQAEALQLITRGIANSKKVNNINKINTENTQQIISNLTEFQFKLQSVHIVQIHIAKGMKELQKLKKLKKLHINLSCNSLRDQGLFGLANLLQSLNELNELECILRMCEATDKGVSQLIRSISNCIECQQLKLNLLSNELTQKSMNIDQCFSKLKKLKKFDMNISCNKLGDFGIRYMCKSIILSSCIRILRLVIDSCDVTQKGCLYVGRLIASQNKLQQFQLSIKHNAIKFQGIQYICAGLLKCKKLKKLALNFDGTEIGDYSANYLSGCLLKMKMLVHLDLNLDCCDLSSQTMQNIVKITKQFSSIAEDITINMRRNKKIKQQLYEEIIRDLQGKKVAIKIDNPGEKD